MMKLEGFIDDYREFTCDYGVIISSYMFTTYHRLFILFTTCKKDRIRLVPMWLAWSMLEVSSKGSTPKSHLW